MKFYIWLFLLSLCVPAFCESDKYLVLTDGNKEIFCESLVVTDTGYRAIINGETKEYKFSEAMLKMKSTAGDNSAPVPAPKKVAADKPKDAPDKRRVFVNGRLIPIEIYLATIDSSAIYIKNGKREPLNVLVEDSPGSKTFHSRNT